MPRGEKDEPEVSPVPEITGEEFRNHMLAMRRSQKQQEDGIASLSAVVAEIRTALVGNQLGTEGLIPQVRQLKIVTERHDRKLLVWGAILSAAGTALVFLKDIALTRK